MVDSLEEVAPWMLEFLEWRETMMRLLMWFTMTLLKNYNVSPGNPSGACDGREEELANKNLQAGLA